MGYEGLRKAFYRDERAAEELYARRFGSASAVHVDVEVAGSPAFFVMTDAVYDAVVRLERADKEILRLSHALPGKALEQFALDNLIDEIVFTNGIEGVQSTRREIGSALDQLGRNDRSFRFKGLVNAYVMLGGSESAAVETPRDVRAIFDGLVRSEVVEENPRNAPDGALFRADAVSVYSPSGAELHRGLSPEPAIVKALETSLRLLNDPSINDVARIAAFHFLFGYIHPFYDGNGRVNRYISSLYLTKGHERVLGYGLSFAIRERLDDYYAAFEQVEHRLNRGDLTPFVITFCDMAAAAAERIRITLEGKRDDFAALESAALDAVPVPVLYKPGMRDLASLLVQAALFTDRGISTRELGACFGVTRATVSNRIARLGDYLAIEKEQRGKDMYYKADLSALRGASPRSQRA